MTYVIAATYEANDGEANEVLSALQEMTPLTRAEPGCEAYTPHRSTEDPNIFFLYERYANLEAFAAHMEAEYFERLIKGQVWPRLANRTVVRAEPLEEL